MGTEKRRETRQKRKRRVRKKVKGTPEMPRLNVFRSSKHIYAQIIDDINSKTLTYASTVGGEMKELVDGKGGNRKGASIVGETIAKRALEIGIKRVVFDRNGFLYHGRVKALAEAARAKGLEF